MMFNSKESKISIFRSLVAASIFLLFLRPILEFLWSILVKFSSYSYSFLIDSAYKNAALGQRNWLDFVIFTLVFMGIIAIAIISMFNYNYEQSILTLQTKVYEEQDEQKKISLEKEFFKKKFKTIIPKKYPSIIRYIVIFCICFCGLSLIFSAYVDMQLNTEFNQRLNVISPYITDSQTKLLKSKWAQMETRKDFELIDEQIKLFAQQYEIILPKQLLR